jgi:hypothetical protein
MVFKATGLDDRDVLPWLEYDSAGEPIEGQVESDLLDAWFDKTIPFDDPRYESWGSRTASQYAPGFELMGLLGPKTRMISASVRWTGAVQLRQCRASQ